MKKLLFTELIIAGMNGNNEAYIEAYNRLKFCGFDENTIKYIIYSEKLIIQKRNLKFQKPLHKTFLWVNNLDSYKDVKLFPLPRKEYFLTDINNIASSTLSLGELIFYYDEAYYISHFRDNAPLKVLKETIEIAQYEDYRSWIVEEFYSKIELLYRLAKKKKKADKNITDIAKIHTFYDNEVHIIMSYKWRELMNIPNKWEAYTKDYYDTI